ncbi:MAG: hypothetical protein IPG72_05920 [Ardenticatenales bacterium]|nr:hypothetical protein [Ardenticatenales bacterium]
MYGIPIDELRMWLGEVWPDVAETAAYGHSECSVHVAPISNPRAAAIYMSKPDGRNVANAIGPWGKRWCRWGDPTPFRSEVVTADLPDAVADRMLRHLCRFAHLRRRAYPSLTLTCDPAQWSRVLAYEVERHYQLSGGC